MVNIPKTLFDIEIQINGDRVGRAEGLTINRNQTLQHKHEAGNRNPYAIQRLGIEPQGSITRAWVDNELLIDLVDYKDGYNDDFTLIGVDKISGENWIIEGAVIGNTTHNLTFDNGEETQEFYATKIYPQGAGLD